MAHLHTLHANKPAGKLDEKIVRAEEGRFGDVECPPWKLTSREIKKAEERLLHLIIPSHLDFSCKYVFSHPSRLKSHDWKQV